MYIYFVIHLIGCCNCRWLLAEWPQGRLNVPLSISSENDSTQFEKENNGRCMMKLNDTIHLYYKNTVLNISQHLHDPTTFIFHVHNQKNIHHMWQALSCCILRPQMYLYMVIQNWDWNGSSQTKKSERWNVEILPTYQARHLSKRESKPSFKTILVGNSTFII